MGSHGLSSLHPYGDKQWCSLLCTPVLSQQHGHSWKGMTVAMYAIVGCLSRLPDILRYQVANVMVLRSMLLGCGCGRAVGVKCLPRWGMLLGCFRWLGLQCCNVCSILVAFLLKDLLAQWMTRLHCEWLLGVSCLHFSSFVC